MVELLSERALLIPLVVSCLLYGIALGALSNGWRNLVQTVSGVPLSFQQGLSIYAVANIAKYLPGNVFHFAARQVLARSAGAPHLAIAQATILELALMLACSLGLIIVLGARYLPERLHIPVLAGAFTPRQIWAVFVLITILGGAAALAILARTGLLRRMLGVDVYGLAVPAVSISLFFAGQCLLAVYLGHAVGSGRSPAAPGLLIAAAYQLAWLAGLVVPGAPGGLGVREGVLVLLLGGVTGEAFALALAAVMRFVSTAGDAIFAGVGYPLLRRARELRERQQPADHSPP
jgi:uncharacterized membrane protein YbhN (UPF0104 family)